jgi:hypothetical protein
MRDLGASFWDDGELDGSYGCSCESCMQAYYASVSGDPLGEYVSAYSLRRGSDKFSRASPVGNFMGAESVPDKESLVASISSTWSIERPDGQSFEVQAPSSATVLRLKQEIERSTGIMLEQQALWQSTGERPLVNSCSLVTLKEKSLLLLRSNTVNLCKGEGKNSVILRWCASDSADATDKLNLDGCYKLGADGMSAIKETCTNLSELSMMNTCMINQAPEIRRGERQRSAAIMANALEIQQISQIVADIMAANELTRLRLGNVDTVIWKWQNGVLLPDALPTDKLPDRYVSSRHASQFVRREVWTEEVLEGWPPIDAWRPSILRLAPLARVLFLGQADSLVELDLSNRLVSDCCSLANRLVSNHTLQSLSLGCLARRDVKAIACMLAVNDSLTSLSMVAVGDVQWLIAAGMAANQQSAMQCLSMQCADDGDVEQWQLNNLNKQTRMRCLGRLADVYYDTEYAEGGEYEEGDNNAHLGVMDDTDMPSGWSLARIEVCT